MQDAGFKDHRIVKRTVFTSDNQLLIDTLGDITFYSLTVRAFKLRGLEDKLEDYGQCTTYNGGIDDFDKVFKLDNCHSFKRGEPVKIDGNTALMLTQTRFASSFAVTGPGKHKGLFDSGNASTKVVIDSSINVKGPSGCC
mmetsp:Transcript_35451/g.34484  ORF Transcript_35451/g.34484 Transcript_35451/m.34484 type:complete len:140 (+) Transcript_35451:462-881(+)|eukprot:CAMPEP_0170545278 /NCGR_PEP_ID=MMETSP0211-20121228/3723_1 /TAXON_ID=311385 /ORGANISM="Pseudokeronopsis sp., Strain OXSARD2" /LENGTH=139 /DNA_ID=CAMNT_0010849135 /DNA_START=684 /DNA_END=1103 /DNA_ORIENTATION=+